MEPNIKNEETTEEGNVRRLYNDEREQRAEYVRQKSLRNLADQISGDLSTLWEKERLLISSEISEKVSEAKTAVTSIAAGAALCFVGLIAAVFASIQLLGLFMPVWLSAVIVTALCFIVGGVMIGISRRRLEVKKLSPRHSIDTLGEISTTLKERFNEFRH